MKRIGLMAIALFLVIITWGGIFSQPASSQQVESRISNLEVDINRLESRLNRIESLLIQNRRLPSAQPPTITPQPPGRAVQQQRDQMFDRLATLVIELREDVRELQARLAKVEGRR